jgi:hypothetical protein
MWLAEEYSSCQCNSQTAVGYCILQILACYVCTARDTTLKLNRKVEDLEDVRYLVNVLNEVRDWCNSECACNWASGSCCGRSAYISRMTVAMFGTRVHCQTCMSNEHAQCTLPCTACVTTATGPR